jgi:hypothetical protein
VCTFVANFIFFPFALLLLPLHFFALRDTPTGTTLCRVPLLCLLPRSCTGRRGRCSSSCTSRGFMCTLTFDTARLISCA